MPSDKQPTDRPPIVTIFRFRVRAGAEFAFGSGEAVRYAMDRDHEWAAELTRDPLGQMVTHPVILLTHRAGRLRAVHVPMHNVSSYEIATADDLAKFNQARGPAAA